MDEIEFELGYFVAHQLDLQLAHRHVPGEQRREAGRYEVRNVVTHLLVACGRN